MSATCVLLYGVRVSGETELERLGLVPSNVREYVIDRDNGCCRVCGQWAGETPALHHIEYRSEGGLDLPSNLVTIGWLPGHDCHLPVVHARKRLWQPILLAIVEQPGVTAYQARRWAEKAGRAPATSPRLQRRPSPGVAPTA